MLPDFDVIHASQSRTGLFEDADSHYGEIWYQVGKKRDQLRSTIEPVVLGKLYELAGVPSPSRASDPLYPGYPLAAAPRGAAPLFYLVWPAAAVLAYFVVRRRSSCRNPF